MNLILYDNDRSDVTNVTDILVLSALFIAYDSDTEKCRLSHGEVTLVSLELYT